MSTPPDDAVVLTNGRYTSCLSPAGNSYSRFADRDLTRYSDTGGERPGWFLMLRDLTRYAAWSVTPEPLACDVRSDSFDASDRSVCYFSSANGIDARLSVCIAGDDDVEIRSLRLDNRRDSGAELEITSYLEPVLHDRQADAAHPAFSKLFVQTAYDRQRRLLTAHRRARSPDEAILWLAQTWSTDTNDAALQCSVETDRMRLLGRGRTLRDPAMMDRPGALSGTLGSVLDPALAFRCRVRIAPGASRTLHIAQAAAWSKAAVADTLRKYRHAESVACALALVAPDRDARECRRPERIEKPAAPLYRRAPLADARGPVDAEALRFFNGFGGFSATGDEYVIRLSHDGDGRWRHPPLPWSNVVANPQAGFLISESGAGYTWFDNSREFRITPWRNDPVSDPVSEAIYLRDEDTAVYWSPMPSPAPDGALYETRHGFGYTEFHHRSNGIRQRCRHFMPRDVPLRILQLRLTNTLPGARRLSVFMYADLLLGEASDDRRGVTTAFDRHLSAIVASNPSSELFADCQVVVAAPTCAQPGFTTGRARFLGDAADTAAPAALVAQRRLDDCSDSDGEPCAALQCEIELPADGASVDVVFVIGAGRERTAIANWVSRYRDPRQVAAAFARVRRFWRHLHGSLRVETPSPAIDLMVNGWLGYQNLSCRLWARSAYYQSGGAFGFRDQLQDSAALIHARPDWTREQILLHARHQFREGDVMHWWHPPYDRGIRTRFSDDLLWLPYMVLFYLDVTADTAVLDEMLPFIDGPTLDDGEDERFITATVSSDTADLFEHCCCAIDRSLAVGAHGLPLIGSGDWNDGMNRVGRLGRGESVWLGFFLYHVLDGFLPLCERRGAAGRVGRYRDHRNRLRVSLDADGWDGQWYRRAFYDDGMPLGSAQNDECRIDAIAQAWAVIAGATSPARADHALDAVERHLVMPEAGMIRLLTPAFDTTPHDPGYIKGYLPGVRENGGQYTHAATWVARAFAEAGRRDRAAALLEMLSPVSHTATPQQVSVYRAEPYVVAADVYGVEPHVGRAGWTWYTGSAAWLYRVAIESVLGLQVESAERILIKPVVPASWDGLRIDYREAQSATRYAIHIAVGNGSGRPSAAQMDGEALAIRDGAAVIPLRHDGHAHRVEITLD